MPFPNSNGLHEHSGDAAPVSLNHSAPKTAAEQQEFSEDSNPEWLATYRRMVIPGCLFSATEGPCESRAFAILSAARLASRFSLRLTATHAQLRSARLDKPLFDIEGSLVKEILGRVLAISPGPRW